MRLRCQLASRVIAWCAGLIALAAALCGPTPALAQSTSAPSAQGTAQAAPVPPYTLLSYDEDYSYLADPAQRADFWDPIKYVPLGEPGWYATFGGETRQRFESYTHYPFAPALENRHGYDLQRYMELADLHFGPDVRLFAELKSALAFDKQVVFPVDEDRLDLDQAFFDLRLPVDPDDRDSLTIRIGRQELQYGSGRLIAVREGPNDRQSFDGGRLILRAGDWRAEALLFRLVDDRPGTFDNQEVTGQFLYGVYASRPLTVPETWPLGGGTHGIDLYALGFRHEQAPFAQGVATEERYSLGTRLYGAARGWDYDTEGTYQFGRFGTGAISAYFVGARFGYTFAGLPLSPRVGLGADVGSGDSDPRRAGLQTFNPMFPAANYFDEASLLTVSNVYDLHPSLDLHPCPRMNLTFDAVLLWRQSTGDGLYGPNVAPILGPGGSSGAGGRGRWVGVQPTVQYAWQIDRHLTFTVSYSHLFEGSYVRRTPPPGTGGNVDFLAVWLTYTF